MEKIGQGLSDIESFLNLGETNMRRFLIKVNGTSYEVEVEELGGTAQAPSAAAASAPAPAYAPVVPTAQMPEKETAPAAPKNLEVPSGATKVDSPLPGTVLSVNVSVGDKVSEGDVLVIIEAMKMENEIMAPKSGTVISIAAARDMSVNTGDPLLVIG
jgi:biotin carboxyl carrier protein